MTGALKGMAAGDYTRRFQSSGRGYEVDQMAEAAEVFRQTALDKAEADRQQQLVVAELATGLNALARGDVGQSGA